MALEGVVCANMIPTIEDWGLVKAFRPLYLHSLILNSGQIQVLFADIHHLLSSSHEQTAFHGQTCQESAAESKQSEAKGDNIGARLHKTVSDSRSDVGPCQSDRCAVRCTEESQAKSNSEEHGYKRRIRCQPCLNTTSAVSNLTYLAARVSGCSYQQAIVDDEGCFYSLIRPRPCEHDMPNRVHVLR